MSGLGDAASRDHEQLDQAEARSRTQLSWQRTSLVVAALALALARLAWQRHDALGLVGGALAVAALISLVGAAAAFARSHESPGGQVAWLRFAVAATLAVDVSTLVTIW